MKYLLLLLLIGLLCWAFTRTRQSRTSDSPDTPSSSTSAQDMARCAHCGIHLPKDEAVLGDKGLYCSTEHRTAAQDRNPV